MDMLDAQWACLNCNVTFRLGDADLPPAPGDGFACPKCGSGNTHPAGKEVRELPEYHGEIPALKN